MTDRSRAQSWIVAWWLVLAIGASGCLDTLDRPVYRRRHDATIDVRNAADAVVDHVSDSRGDSAVDAFDVTRHDAADAPDGIPPSDDVPDENLSGDAQADAEEPDATITDVMEIEASFDDGSTYDVIVTTDVPDVTCPTTCPSGTTCCGGQCVNLSIDEQNCGGCGVVCPAPGVCQRGSCGSCVLGILCGGQQRCCILGLCSGILCP